MRMTAGRFLREKSGLMFKLIIVFLFFTVLGLPSWIGDENPLILFPFFMAAFLLCYTGHWYERFIVGAVFFTLLLSASMLIDSIIWRYLDSIIAAGIKTLLWGAIWLTVWQFVPKTMQLFQSVKLWTLLGSLSLAPLFATLSFTLWNAKWFDEDMYYIVGLRLGYTILPFATLSSLALLEALVVLSRHEELEQSQILEEIKAVYYRGLQREQTEIRMLRHDLLNHIIVAKSLLSQKDIESTVHYLDELSSSAVRTGSLRICENDVANAIFSSKASIIGREGIIADWTVSLPETLAITDVDLCALLGNALDNAIEAAKTAESKHIIVRARADKGVLMLRVENTMVAQPHMENGVFKTTKNDIGAHGFGLVSIRDVVRRYGGSLEIEVKGDRFELVAYLPLQ